MRVALGTFARHGIEAHLGTDLTTGIEMALSHYTRRLRSGRPPLEPPRFCRDSVTGEAGCAFELAIDAETRGVLERQARRHGVSVDQILTHAIFVYLADLDSFQGGNGTPPSRPR